MNKIAITVVSSALLMSMVGCANMTKQDVGVVTGGAIGGAVGSLFGSGSGKIVAAVGGTILGAVIGGAIGHSMDKVDQMQMNQALQNSPGQATTWRNTQTGNTYTVTPEREYYHGDQPCKTFTTKAIIGGKTQTIYGRACRKADGTWRVVNS